MFDDSDSVTGGFLFGLLVGFIALGLIAFNQNSSWERDAIARGFANYKRGHIGDTYFAWKEEDESLSAFDRQLLDILQQPTVHDLMEGTR